MKVSCEVIQDLLPLYVDNACSEDSEKLVEDHMAECETCKQAYEAMVGEGKSEELVKSEAFLRQQTEAVKKVKKKWSKSKKLFLALGIVIGGGLLFLFRKALMLAGVIGLLAVDVATTRVQVFEDVAKYTTYIGEECHKEYGRKRTGGFEIFPEQITLQMYVREFKYVYYNPWDPQYVAYLTVEYKDNEAYEEELNRLREIGVESYEGIYSVVGEPVGYDLVAMNSDKYYGFVYAMVPESGETSITYVGIVFCNYFLDLDIHKYMEEEYLLPGFDATSDNPYEKERMGR